MTSREGWAPTPNNAAELAQIIEEAFEYRGDVTIKTKSGDSILGFIFNRLDQEFIEYYPSEEDSQAQRLAWDELETIHFSGRDTADGKSWEAWVKRYEEKHSQ